MRIIDDITRYIFVSDEPKEADIIFIPGGSYPALPEKAAQLYKRRYAPWVLPSGKYSITIGKFAGVRKDAERYPGEYPTECAFYTDVLVKNGVPRTAVLEENQATFTRENADFSRAVTDQQGLVVKRAIICCKNWHSRRCLMYYQMAFPDTELLIVPADAAGGGISRDNWHRSEKDIGRVLSELAKCGSQMTEEFKEYARRGAGL